MTAENAARGFHKKSCSGTDPCTCAESRPAAYEREESCGDMRIHESHLHNYGEYVYLCPGDKGPPERGAKIGEDQGPRLGKRGVVTSPEGLGAASVEPSSPAPATSAATTPAYRCWRCGTLDPLSHETLCPRALMAGEAEAIHHAFERDRLSRAPGPPDWESVPSDTLFGRSK